MSCPKITHGNLHTVWTVSFSSHYRIRLICNNLHMYIRTYLGSRLTDRLVSLALYRFRHMLMTKRYYAWRCYLCSICIVVMVNKVNVNVKLGSFCPRVRLRLVRGSAAVGRFHRPRCIKLYVPPSPRRSRAPIVCRRYLHPADRKCGKCSAHVPKCVQ